MIQEEWIECSRHITKESQNYPQLKNFFRLISSLLFLFPHLNQSLLINKRKFLEQLHLQSTFWEMRIIKQIFQFQPNDSLIRYLTIEDWWWIFLNNIKAKENYHEPSILSYFHESLKKLKERKSAGFYITPRDQIKVTCLYALFFFLKNNKELEIDDKSLYQLISRYKYPSKFQFEDNQKIAHILLNLKILDPSCGTGLFLVEMSSLLLSILLANPIYANISPEEKASIIDKIFSQLYGFDIDSNSVKVTKIILLQFYLQKISKVYSETELTAFINRLKVSETNFLEGKITPSSKYNIIIGNPPYVRHHGLPTTSIKALRDELDNYYSVFSDLLFKWDKKADLYIYFWLKSVTQVFEGGVIALVLSRAWLSSQYTNPLQQVLITSFSLDLVLELPFEVWESAEIRTHIIVGHRINVNSKPEKTAVIVWKKSLKSLFLFETQEFYQQLKTYNRSGMSLSTKETESYRVTIVSFLNSSIINIKKTFPFLRLDYFTMSSYLAKLLNEKKNQFCLLNDLGKLVMGSTTGANQYFYLTNKRLEHYKIPREYLYLMTKSPKEWKTISSPSKELRYFLHIPKKLSKNSPRKLLEYINEIQYDILKRPYFKNKTEDNWYQVPLVQPEILIPNMIFKRSFVVYNSDKLHIDKQWIGFWANNKEWLFFLLGFLNSTLGILLREIQSTKTLGLGSLKLSLKECRNLLVLNPQKIPNTLIKKFHTCISSLGKAKIDPITNRNLTSDYSKIQSQLDHLIIVECLGLNPMDIIKIQEILKFELSWRFAKEKSKKLAKKNISAG